MLVNDPAFATLKLADVLFARSFTSELTIGLPSP